ncbi:MAG: 2Fe-2S iron-sulfur cluster-binding protein, partial [Proteobacteria bacterium]|nr:2Fe-2S iron-sulfur cluster-binding protein [Pseudomonadota bacterium]
MTETSNQVPDDKVTIEIDGQTVLADKGSMIIHATDAHGINVPRFCYHKKLSIAANCRMCMVDVEKAPKPLPACATPVAEGMKIYTRSKRATSGQKNAMEFLLINHPL